MSEMNLPPHGPLPEDWAPPRRMSCTFCGESTLVSELNDLGARCFRCYKAYCRAPQSDHHRWYTQEGETPTPREVVQRLIDRKSRGERLGNAQLEYIETESRRLNPPQTE